MGEKNIFIKVTTESSVVYIPLSEVIVIRHTWLAGEPDQYYENLNTGDPTLKELYETPPAFVRYYDNTEKKIKCIVGKIQRQKIATHMKELLDIVGQITEDEKDEGKDLKVYEAWESIHTLVAIDKITAADYKSIPDDVEHDINIHYSAGARTEKVTIREGLYLRERNEREMAKIT